MKDLPLEEAEKCAQRLAQVIGENVSPGWLFALALLSAGEKKQLTYVSNASKSAMPDIFRGLADKLDMEGSIIPKEDKALLAITKVIYDLCRALSSKCVKLAVTVPENEVIILGVMSVQAKSLRIQHEIRRLIGEADKIIWSYRPDLIAEAKIDPFENF